MVHIFYLPSPIPQSQPNSFPSNDLNILYPDLSWQLKFPLPLHDVDLFAKTR